MLSNVFTETANAAPLKGFAIDLHSAASRGQLEVVKLFIEDKEQSIQDKNDLDQTPLFCAALNGHLNVVRYLVEQGANINEEHEFNLDFLNTLALQERFSLVTYLAKQKPIVLCTLEEAAEKGYFGLVQYLVEVKKYAIDTTDSFDKTPLYKAAMHGHLDIVRYLVGQGINIEKKTEINRNFLNALALKDHFSLMTYFAKEKSIVIGSLQEAATKGNLGIVKYLVEKLHKDIHAKDNLLETPIQKAAMNGHLDVLRYLLTQGAKVEDIDKIAPTLLSEGVKKGYLDLLKYLLEEKKVDIQSGFNWFLLEKAVRSNQIAIMEYLFHYKMKFETGMSEYFQFLNWVALGEHFLMVDHLNAMQLMPPPLNLWKVSEKGYLGLVRYFVETKNKNINETDSSGETPFYKAAINGHLDVLKYFIEQGVQLEAHSDRFQDLLDKVAIKGHYSILIYLSKEEKIPLPSLWKATEKGYLGILQYLVEVQDKDIQAKHSSGNTILQVAAFCGHLALVKYLIDQGADVNDIHEIIEDLFNNTVEKGRLDMLRYLLEEQKEDINITNRFAWKLVERAAFSGQLAILNYLCHHDTDWNLDEIQDLSFLNDVALKGHFPVIDYFVAQGYISLPNLWEAAQKGYLSLVRYLVESRNYNDINATDNLNETPLYKAAMNGHLDIVRYLAERGANVKEERKFDIDCLDTLALKRYFSLVSYLLAEKALTLGTLQEASATGYLGLVHYLVEVQGKDIHAADNLNETPLYRAAMNGHFTIVLYLVSRGASIKEERRFDLDCLNTLASKKYFLIMTYLASEKSIALTLWEAAEKGYLEIMRYLVEELHKNIHIKDNAGRNLLHIAAFYDQLAIAQYLIHSGVDVNGKDNLAHSPLQTAAMNGHLNALRYLLNQGARIQDIDDISEELLENTVEKGHLDMLQYLIEEPKIAINSADHVGWGLIERAAFNGRLAILKYLFDHQADWKSDKRLNLLFLNDIALKDQFSVVKYLSKIQPISLPALWEAIVKDYLGIVKYLVEEEKIDVNKIENQDWSPLGKDAYQGPNNLRDKTPVDFAIEQGHLRIVQYFVEEKKLNLNMRNSRGWTFLDRAAHSGQLDIVKYLIRQNAEFGSGHTPDLYLLNRIAVKRYFSVVEYLSEINQVILPTLWEAVEKGYLGLIKYLIEEKAFNIHIKNSSDQNLLHKAAVYDFLNVIKYLLRQAVNLYAKDRQGDTPIDKAIKAGYLNIVKYFVLEKKFDVHAKNYLNQTPLHQAVAYAHLNLVKYFMSQGADLNAVDLMNDTPVDKAVKGGYLTIVEYLIEEQHIDVNTRNHLGQTLLHQAAFAGRLNIVQYLLNRGADLDATDNRDDTPISKAIEAGRLDIVKYLIDKWDLNLGTPDLLGKLPINTAVIRGQLEVIKEFFETSSNDPNIVQTYSHLLHYAAYYDHLDIVKYLVNKNYDLSTQNGAGNTPLHVAILGQNLEIVKYLVEKGADLTQINHDGNTPFQLATFQDNPDIVKYFVTHLNETVDNLLTAIGNNALGLIKYLIEDKIVDLSTLDEHYKQTALNKAIFYDHDLDIVKYLVDNGFDHPVKPHLKLTALHVAVKYRRLEAVKFFIKENADLEAIDDHDFTPLHLAVQNDDLETVKYLVEKKAHLNTRNDEGDTPLHTAVSEDYPEIVKYLLENSVDSEVKNTLGYTALELAKSSHQDLVQYFEPKNISRNRRMAQTHPDDRTTIKKTDTVSSCASRSTSWINDGWSFLTHLPQSLFASSNKTLPYENSANVGGDTTSLNNAPVHLNATLLLSGVIASKITKKKLDFFSVHALSAEEALNARVQTAISKTF